MLYHTLPYFSLPYLALPNLTLPFLSSPRPTLLYLKLCVPSANPLSAVQHLLAAKYLIELMGGPRHPELVTVYFRLVGTYGLDTSVCYPLCTSVIHSRRIAQILNLKTRTRTHTPEFLRTWTLSLALTHRLYIFFCHLYPVTLSSLTLVEQASMTS